MSGSPQISFFPTVNVDVGGKTVWTVTNTEKELEWSSPGEGTIVQLKPLDGRGSQCQITGLAGGDTTITVKEKGHGHHHHHHQPWEATKTIGVGLMFVYAADGSLYAASAAGFVPVDSTKASLLPIPTLEQMAGQAAYFLPSDGVPPAGGAEADAAANVTCYVINLGYIREKDVWPSDSSSPKTDKKSGG